MPILFASFYYYKGTATNSFFVNRTMPDHTIPNTVLQNTACMLHAFTSRIRDNKMSVA